MAALIKVPFAPVPQSKHEGFHRLCLLGSAGAATPGKALETRC